jgi:predicted 3-demethylubiquinone-9 3-methyltransferase (glyoxalase superfamily)
VSRQIVPNILGEVLEDKDATTRSKKVMEAMLQKRKIDIEGLKKAYAE